MGYKQPRVPEYRESEGISRYMKPLILFLKDFSLASWKANTQRMREIAAVNVRIDELPELPEIDYPVTSVNGKAGDVTLDAGDVGALGAKGQAADSACFAGYSWAQALDALHPVGSVYISLEEASPAALFGGTWERLEDVFLLGAGGAYAADERGGEAEHVLTIDEMPAHKHDWSITGCTNAGFSGDKYNYYVSTYYSGRGTAEMYETGGDEAHNNMPPYLAAYMWRRVA